MFFIVLIFWIFFDLLTKKLAFLYLQKKINLIWDFLYLKYIENSWIAFSIQITWLKYLTIFLIILIFLYYFKERKKIKNKKLLDLSFWLILSWAIGNWIERVFYWKVIDFIWIKYFSVFNFADIFISLWTIIYLIILLWVFDHQKEISKKY